MGLRSFKLNPYLFSPCAPFATAENDNVCSWRSTSGVWKWKVHELRQIHIGCIGGGLFVFLHGFSFFLLENWIRFSFINYYMWCRSIKVWIERFKEEKLTFHLSSFDLHICYQCGHLLALLIWNFSLLPACRSMLLSANQYHPK